MRGTVKAWSVQALKYHNPSLEAGHSLMKALARSDVLVIVLAVSELKICYLTEHHVHRVCNLKPCRYKTPCTGALDSQQSLDWIAEHVYQLRHAQVAKQKSRRWAVYQYCCKHARHTGQHGLHMRIPCLPFADHPQ